MKYLTNEWLIQYKLSYINSVTKKSKQAQTQNVIFYNNLYRNRYLKFIEIEKSDEIYSNPRKDLELCEQRMNEQGITDEERKLRKCIYRYYAKTCEKRIAAGAPFVFDENHAARKFEEGLRQKIELLKQMPQTILDKVADIGVFAFGYVSEEVKRLLKSYCRELKRQCKGVLKQAERETEKAEKYLTKRLGVSEYTELFLTDIIFENEDIYILFDDGEKLLIKNGEILEREEEKLFAWNADIPNSGWSMVIAAELYRTDKKFEIHFLMENRNEYERCTIWYLTFRGTDIQEIITPNNEFRFK